MERYMNTSLVDKEYISKCEEYTTYIDEHIANVKKAYSILFGMPEKPLTNIGKITGEKLEQLLNRLEMAINVHDSSKYLDEEFEGYRKKYYPTTLEKEMINSDSSFSKLVDAEAETAWHHHYMTNDHHPLYWRYTDVIEQNGQRFIVALKQPLAVARPMGIVATLHMICDWQGMSLKFNGHTVDWYMSEDAADERNDMNPKTRKLVERILSERFDREIPETLPGDKAPQ